MEAIYCSVWTNTPTAIIVSLCSTRRQLCHHWSRTSWIRRRCWYQIRNLHCPVIGWMCFQWNSSVLKCLILGASPSLVLFYLCLPWYSSKSFSSGKASKSQTACTPASVRRPASQHQSDSLHPASVRQPKAQHQSDSLHPASVRRPAPQHQSDGLHPASVRRPKAQHQSDGLHPSISQTACIPASVRRPAPQHQSDGLHPSISQTACTPASVRRPKAQHQSDGQQGKKCSSWSLKSLSHMPGTIRIVSIEARIWHRLHLALTSLAHCYSFSTACIMERNEQKPHYFIGIMWSILAIWSIPTLRICLDTKTDRNRGTTEGNP